MGLVGYVFSIFMTKSYVNSHLFQILSSRNTLDLADHVDCCVVRYPEPVDCFAVLLLIKLCTCSSCFFLRCTYELVVM